MSDNSDSTTVIVTSTNDAIHYNGSWEKTVITQNGQYADIFSATDSGASFLVGFNGESSIHSHSHCSTHPTRTAT